MDRVEFTRGDAIGKVLNLKGWTRKQLADAAELRPNTITDLLNNNVESEPDTVQKVCKVLDVDVDDIDELVAQMNGKTRVSPFRSPSERDEDKDPIKREAAERAKRIAALPLPARMAIYNVIAALEDAYIKKS
jgi:transcriptional regulator with XRE-family HTH domain